MSVFETVGQAGKLDAVDPGVADLPPFGPSLYRRWVQNLTGDPIQGPDYGLMLGNPGMLDAPAVAVAGVVSVTGNGIWVTFDGTTPGANIGLWFPADQLFTVTGRASLLGMQWWDAVGGAVVNVAYFT